jgi:hypothetical protein
MTKKNDEPSQVILFAANTAQIVMSALTGRPTVKLYNLDEPGKPPNPEPLSKLYRLILIAVIVFTGLCLVGLVSLGFTWPEPTTSQQKTLDVLIHGFTTGLGCLVGLLVGKGLR